MYLQLSMTSYKYLSDIECIYDQDSDFDDEYINKSINDTNIRMTIGWVYAAICVVLLYEVFLHRM